jgi:uncharacterized protein YbbC (DUF1343 family)
MLIFFFSILFIINISFAQQVTTGAEILLSENLLLLEGRNIGIVTNHTAILKNGTHLVDELTKHTNIKIVALFGPEHGIRGDAPAGEHISGGIDSKTQIPVYSLYGTTKKPTKEMLRNVDLLIFDIQDVGARFYTYISTLFYTIEAANENHIPLIILDRPNPIGGVWVDGPIRKNELSSFVGIAPLPVIHGMTVGELAQFFIGEGLIKSSPGFSLKIIKMKNWDRKMFFNDTGLLWINPSPNIPTLETALVYPGTCLIEGTNISEGRGTLNPFLTIGSPFIKSQDVIQKFAEYGHSGLMLSEISFVPMDIDGMAKNPKYKNIKCNGINISVNNYEEVKPFEFGIHLIHILNKLYPDNFEFKEKSFDLLTGDKSIRHQLVKGANPTEIISNYQAELNAFKLIRQKYLLY